MNPTNPINTQWFVIHTKPSNEQRVETNLSNQEIEVFLPLFETFQYANGRMVPKIKPLFPNYLFAHLDIDLHYYKVKWTRGVSKILGIGSEPIPISEKVIQTIKERMGDSNLVKLEDGLEKGNLVQFTSGPFKDLMGVFDKKMSDGKRVRVLLGLIGVDVLVQVSRWQIKKVA
jgi:transcriptional antiterminator RfaH